jgi:hypothetical protein
MLQVRMLLKTSGVSSSSRDDCTGCRKYGTPTKVPSWTGMNEGAARAAGTTKMKEQSRNVYENKGPLWKTGAEAGML